MGLRKCPKCDLNYIRDDEKLCSVCLRKNKANRDEDEDVLCAECGERRAMKGRELCSVCYKEKLKQQQPQDRNVGEEDPVEIDIREVVTLDDVDEVPLDTDAIRAASSLGVYDDDDDDMEEDEEEEEVHEQDDDDDDLI